jgi:hypothetical protein
LRSVWTLAPRRTSTTSSVGTITSVISSLRPFFSACSRIDWATLFSKPE